MLHVGVGCVVGVSPSTWSLKLQLVKVPTPHRAVTVILLSVTHCQCMWHYAQFSLNTTQSGSRESRRRRFVSGSFFLWLYLLLSCRFVLFTTYLLINADSESKPHGTNVAILLVDHLAHRLPKPHDLSAWAHDHLDNWKYRDFKFPGLVYQQHHDDPKEA